MRIKDTGEDLLSSRILVADTANENIEGLKRLAQSLSNLADREIRYWSILARALQELGRLNNDTLDCSPHLEDLIWILGQHSGFALSEREFLLHSPAFDQMASGKGPHITI